MLIHHGAPNSNIVSLAKFKSASGRVRKLVWVPVGEDGAFDIAEFEKRLTDRTKLVAITHNVDALGTVVPISRSSRSPMRAASR